MYQRETIPEVFIENQDDSECMTVRSFILTRFADDAPHYGYERLLGER